MREAAARRAVEGSRHSPVFREEPKQSAPDAGYLRRELPQNSFRTIDYESIRFYGGHTVLVCKDNLWGAKSLGLDTNIFNILFKVSIPNEYLDIKILDDYQHFFGCKKKSLYSSEEYYTIVQ